MRRSILSLVIICLGVFQPSSRTAPADFPSSGFQYYRDAVGEVPWSVQVLKIDRSNPTLELHTTFGTGRAIALVSLPKQVATLPAGLGRPIAAINGDYYQNRDPYKGDPKGIQISLGELISAPCGWTCFWIDTDGQPNMDKVISHFTVTFPNGEVLPMGLNEPRSSGKVVLYSAAVGPTTRTSGGTEIVLDRAASGPAWMPLRVGEEYVAVVREVRESGNHKTSSDSLVLSIGPIAARTAPKLKKGDVLRLSLATEPSLHGSRTAISGGPALVTDGKIQVGWSAIRHPRSALGWNKDFIFLVQVDGRQSGFSVGMTESELAQYMKKLGCDQALNLDGGGSATFWALGQVMNSPSEGRARGIANALVLVQKSSESDSPKAHNLNAGEEDDD